MWWHPGDHGPLLGLIKLLLWGMGHSLSYKMLDRLWWPLLKTSRSDLTVMEEGDDRVVRRESRQLRWRVDKAEGT